MNGNRNILWILLICCVIALAAVIIIYCKGEPGDTTEAPKKAQSIIKNQNENLAELNKKDIIKDHVHKLNTSCPLDMNNGDAKVESVFFDGQKITYNVNCLRDYPHEEFTNNLKKQLDNMVLYMYVIYHGESDEYLNDIINRKCSTVYSINFPDGGNSTITIPFSDIESAKKQAKSNRKESLDRYVKGQISLLNYQLPAEVDSGFVFHSITLSNEYIVFNINLDFDYFQSFKEDYDETKMLIYQDLKDSYRSILETCKAAKIGVQYKMKKSGSSEILNFEYPYEELMKDPFIINLNQSKVNLI